MGTKLLSKSLYFRYCCEYTKSLLSVALLVDNFSLEFKQGKVLLNSGIR